MLFIIITAILIAFSYTAPPTWRIANAWFALSGVGGGLLVNWAVAALAAWLTLRWMRRADADRELALRRFQWMRWMNTVVLLASFGGLVHALDWPGVVRQTWRLERWVLVDDVLVLLPFIGGLALQWFAYWRVEDFSRSRACDAGEPGTAPLPRMTRWMHVDFLLRHNLGLVLAPLLVILAVQDTVRLVLGDGRLGSAAEMAGSLLGLAAMLVLAPVVLKSLWRARSLPAGALRSRLERLSRRLGFRASDVLVWQTQGTVINAAVAGILPVPRYVLLSDGLLNHLSEDEVEAVFGHEVGHIRHHHLWFYVGFLMSASFVLLITMTALSQVLVGILGQSTARQFLSLAQGLVLPLAGVILYFGVLFGFLSRRFERQADIFGCHAVSCGRPDCPDRHEPHAAAAVPSGLCRLGVETFVSALEKIARLNGLSRETRSWRHFSIARRVEFLQTLASHPDRERRFQRVVWVLKSAVILAVCGGLWLIVARSPEFLVEVLR